MMFRLLRDPIYHSRIAEERAIPHRRDRNIQPRRRQARRSMIPIISGRAPRDFIIARGDDDLPFPRRLHRDTTAVIHDRRTILISPCPPPLSAGASRTGHGHQWLWNEGHGAYSSRRRQSSLAARNSSLPSCGRRRAGNAGYSGDRSWRICGAQQICRGKWHGCRGKAGVYRPTSSGG
ncbi:MAG: hypothetical protein JWQ98_1145 [Chlorobi bacterium]|nr:hypothetical protein [Chlorobiota bacterium]